MSVEKIVIEPDAYYSVHFEQGSLNIRGIDEVKNHGQNCSLGYGPTSFIPFHKLENIHLLPPGIPIELTYKTRFKRNFNGGFTITRKENEYTTTKASFSRSEFKTMKNYLKAWKNDNELRDYHLK